jgi:hypothetical protein
MNPTTLLQLIAILIGAAEEIIPIFIHNPVTQKVDAIVFSSAHSVLANTAPKA